MNRPQKISTIALIAASAACGISFAAPERASVPVVTPAKPAPGARNCSVTLYGDSILNGSFFPAGRIAEPPAAGIRRMRPAYRVVDRTVAGDNAQLRMPFIVGNAIDTHIVVLGHGLNDAGNSLPYEAPLRTMVQRAKSSGRAVVITGISRTITGTANYDSYNAIARRVAAEEGAVFTDWGAVPVVAADMADAVHPA